MHRRIVVFISSTGDLQQERDAVERALSDLEIDGSRFESWPSSATSPINECLERIEEADAFVLILGERYGSLTESGISVSHLEYRYAREIQPPKPIFVYILQTSNREQQQDRFLDEIEKRHFHCKEITNIEQLKEQVKLSFLQEFTRCFYKVHSTPPKKLSAPVYQVSTSSPPALPKNKNETFALLQDYYAAGDDLSIHRLAPQCEATFSQYLGIMNLLFMAEVNLGMNRGPADKERLRRAVAFWDRDESRRRWASYSLDYNRGNAFSVLGRISDAERLYRAALEQKPDFAECWKNLGSLSESKGDVPAARKCYEEALQHNPRLFEALYALAVLSMQEVSDPQKALSLLNRIPLSERTSGHIAAVQGWKARANLQLGNYAKGIANIEEALQTSPKAEWAWSIAGRLYALARRHDRRFSEHAARFWEQFLDRYPENPQAWAEFGYTLWSLRDGDKWLTLRKQAFDAFQKAIELGLHDDGLAWDRIGHIYQEQDNWVEAEKAYRKATERNPTAFGYCLGVSLIFLGRYEEALPWVLKAAQRHQPDAMSWFQVGVCKAGLGQSMEAKKAYAKAIHLDKDYPQAWFNLGGIYWNEADFRRAGLVWKKAIAKFPDYEGCDRARELMRLIRPDEGRDQDRRGGNLWMNL